jgi:nucleotide-binding universal stress UspA family protein
VNIYAPAQGVLVGVDGSDGAAGAAAWAAGLVDRRGSTLHLVHALNLAGASSLLTTLSFDEYRRSRTKQAETQFYALRDSLLDRFPGLPISVQIAAGEPVETLVEATFRPGLTVVGTRGRGGFPALGLGSVGLRLAAHCHGPVILVPAADGAFGCAPGPAAGEVVLGVAGHEPAGAIGFAFAMAEEFGAGLRAVHAWQPIPPYGGYYSIEPSILADAAEGLLDTALAGERKRHDTVTATAEAVCDEPAAALLSAARGARLLVLGAHHHRTPLSIGVGSVLHALLTHAPCPVAVVPQN